MAKASRGILVKNLIGPLSKLGEKEVENLFQPFGQVIKVDMAFDDLL